MSRLSPKEYKNIDAPLTDNIDVKKDDNIIKQVRRYKLITPLFGGGVEAGVNDDITPISGKAIRGHLRFWWRATRGGQFNKLNLLLDFESQLFGAASDEKDKKINSEKKYSVKVDIEVTNKGREDCPYEVKNNRNGVPQTKQRRGTIVPSYASFPLQPSTSDRDYRDGMKTKGVKVGVEFTLTISFPLKHREHIEAALWAWETFGGVGARTRRGFGALRLESIDGKNVPRPDTLSKLSQVKTAIDDQLKKYIVEGEWIEHISHLSQETVYEVTPFNEDPLVCWKGLIEKLNRFRQQRNPPRIERIGNREIEIPGRSKWNEPEAIREITDQRLLKHQPINPNFIKFPRAAFGLPIAFQFKDRDKNNPFNNNKDPRKTLLKLAESERLASPLILRPLAVSRTQFVGIALILEGTLLPDDMQLVLRNDEDRDKNTIRDGLKAGLEDDEAKQIMKSDNRTPLLTDTDVLNAFLDFLNS
jgi:CRISPR-associated protein Cmr1